MPKSVKLELGDFKSEKYFLYVRSESDFNDPVKFVATVYFKTLDPENLEERKTEIARIENKAHGFCHIDKLYEEGDPKEKVDMDVFEAWEYLKDNWRKFARRYRSSRN